MGVESSLLADLTNPQSRHAHRCNKQVRNKLTNALAFIKYMFYIYLFVATYCFEILRLIMLLLVIASARVYVGSTNRRKRFSDNHHKWFVFLFIYQRWATEFSFYHMTCLLFFFFVNVCFHYDYKIILTNMKVLWTIMRGGNGPWKNGKNTFITCVDDDTKLIIIPFLLIVKISDEILNYSKPSVCNKQVPLPRKVFPDHILFNIVLMITRPLEKVISINDK